VIRLARPLLGDEEVAAAEEVIRSGWLVQGPRVAAFEELLCARTDSAHTVCCSSGTAALQLALAALDLPPGTRVLVPAYTFPATVNAVLLAGLSPVLIDIDPSTYNLDPEDCLRVLEPGDVLLAVHQFGLPAPLDELPEETLVIEDAACALGSRLGGRLAGSLGAMGCFSFHPRKIITTAEGGAVTSSDEGLAERLRLLRNHGMARQPDGSRTFETVGWNFRLSELHAALGIVQMGRLDALLEDRQRIAAHYNEQLAGLAEQGLELPRVPAGAEPNWQSYVVRLPVGRSVTATVSALREQGVEASIGAQALHQQAAYRTLPSFDRSLPGTEDAAARALALPVASGLSSTDLQRVTDSLTALIG